MSPGFVIKMLLLVSDHSQRTFKKKNAMLHSTGSPRFEFHYNLKNIFGVFPDYQ